MAYGRPHRLNLAPHIRCNQSLCLHVGHLNSNAHYTAYNNVINPTKGYALLVTPALLDKFLTSKYWNTYLELQASCFTRKEQCNFFFFRRDSVCGFFCWHAICRGLLVVCCFSNFEGRGEGGGSVLFSCFPVNPRGNQFCLAT